MIYECMHVFPTKRIFLKEGMLDRHALRYLGKTLIRTHIHWRIVISNAAKMTSDWLAELPRLVCSVVETCSQSMYICTYVHAYMYMYIRTYIVLQTTPLPIDCLHLVSSTNCHG